MILDAVDEQLVYKEIVEHGNEGDGGWGKKERMGTREIGKEENVRGCQAVSES